MKTMTWEEYLHLFDQILSGEFTDELYQKPDYRNYVKMNNSRLYRWLKNAELNPELITIIQKIDAPQYWYLITEPWCGDAAHSTPLIAMMAEQNPNISLKVVLRDANLEFMDQYLTNGGRSIPKLIARDSREKDLFVWGPRPAELQTIFLQLKAKNETFEVISRNLQQWYNQNKGEAVQREIMALLSSIQT
jgi:hypothetical protein